MTDHRQPRDRTGLGSGRQGRDDMGGATGVAAGGRALAHARGRHRTTDPAATAAGPEAVILCGIQGAGKTSLYRERWLDTHVRISLDLLRTRHREALFMRACLESRQRFVVDNTNPTPGERARYVVPAREAGFWVVGCLVEVAADEALARNAERPPGRRVPIAGVLGTRKRLDPPTAGEGFDELWRARADPGGRWVLEPLQPPQALTHLPSHGGPSAG